MSIFRVDPEAFRREAQKLTRELRQQAPRQYARGGLVHRGRSILIGDLTPPTRAEITEMSGAMLIRTNGLADGYVPPSASLSPPPGCPHAQAEPVILSTEETVACVCISCLTPLPANWIGQQRDRAEREARCTHSREYEDRRFGSPRSRLTCHGCGRVRESE